MGFYMGTTQVASENTAMEISKLLSRAGAVQILNTFESGELIGLSFLIKKGPIAIPFRLPIKWESVLEAMKRDRKTPRSLCNRPQATRTAWRIILRWIQAQLALIETGSAHLEEVFLPYAEIRDGKTVFQIYEENQFKALEAPKP